jgi:hypothetical protein
MSTRRRECYDPLPTGLRDHLISALSRLIEKIAFGAREWGSR